LEEFLDEFAFGGAGGEFGKKGGTLEIPEVGLGELGGGVEKFFQVFLGDFDALELTHALGSGHGVEDQIVILGQIISPSKKVIIFVIGLLQKKWQGRRRSG
jgi:hypothetical protein